MANGFKSGGRDFSPGESGNPNGRPALPEDLNDARRLNKSELERILNESIHLTAEELGARIKAPTTTSLELIVLKIIAAAVNRGDERRLGFLLDRLVGPVPKKVQLGGDAENPSPVHFGVLTKEQRRDLINDARGGSIPAPVPTEEKESE